MASAGTRLLPGGGGTGRPAKVAGHFQDRRRQVDQVARIVARLAAGGEEVVVRVAIVEGADGGIQHLRREPKAACPADYRSPA